MKKYLIGIIAILVALLYIALWQYNIVDRKWKAAEANVKAYSEELSDAASKSTALQLTVDQLEYFNDSILKTLNNTREELNIKDKNLEALQYLVSEFTRVDTITISNIDTIFKEPDFAIDTLIGDKWYTLAMSLRYPSDVIVSPKFKSEKHIVVSTRKETINPPKKFFLLRIFQKKHKVLRVDVVEKNPYMEDQKSKYIEIMK